MAHSINLDLYNLNFVALSAFANTVHRGFVINATEYPDPKPMMPVFRNHIDMFQAAIAKWGVTGNRGSHKDYLQLLDERKVIRNDLRQLSYYTRRTKPGDIESWSKLGFKIKRPKSKPQPLPMVQDFHHFISRSVPAPGIKLKWKKPLDTDRRAVKGYIIQRSNTSEYPSVLKGGIIANIIGFTSSTSFIDNNPLAGENWYWVAPFNSVGFGVTSEALMVVSRKIKS